MQDTESGRTATKVFGIGFQKTGTTSLGVILRRLGYRTAGYWQFRHLRDKNGLTLEELEARALELAAEFDAFKDTPWPLFYQSLDRVYPGSKFVHVTRKPDAWIRSAVNDFAKHPNALHTAIYGVPFPKGFEDIWLERYNRHNAEVRDYFRDRPDDCLFLNLEDGVTFESVCTFLGHPIIATGSPKVNTRANKSMRMFLQRVRSRVWRTFGG